MMTGDATPSVAPPRDERGMRFPTFLREVLAVILGIVLALGADAWWEDRQEAERGRALRASIRAELEGDSVMRAALRTDAARGVAAMNRILVQIHGSGEPDLDSIRADLQQAMSLTARAEGLETYGAALSSGEIRFLEAPGLERALSGYAEAVEVLRHNDTFFLETVTVGEFGRAVARHGGLIQLVGRSARYPSDLANALADPSFRGGLEMLSFVWGNRVLQVQGLEAASDTVLVHFDGNGR